MIIGHGNSVTVRPVLGDAEEEPASLKIDVLREGIRDRTDTSPRHPVKVKNNGSVWMPPRAAVVVHVPPDPLEHLVRQINNAAGTVVIPLLDQNVSQQVMVYGNEMLLHR